MGNVLRVIGRNPLIDPDQIKISEMKAGDSGYTVPWNYDEATNWLDLNGSINPRSRGTSCLYVECIAPGEYLIEFHEPKFKNPFN